MGELETKHELRGYQQDIAEQGTEILKKLHILYLCMQVRVGKTLTSLEIAKKYGAKRVLFLTKVKAIPSIQDDYDKFGFDYEIVIINDESLHKVEDNDFDIVIHDEHHRFGTFPKANQKCLEFRKRFKHLPMIFLSGTPHPESYMQIFHQFYVSKHSPFGEGNFYGWFKRMGFLNSQINKTGYKAKDWSAKTENIIDQIADMEFPDEVEKHLTSYLTEWNEDRLDNLKEIIDPYFIRFTQEEAGFKSSIKEEVLYVRMSDTTYELTKQLIKDRVLEGDEEDILGDTAVKLQQKLHQMFSGTVKFESGNSFTLDDSKAKYIQKRFKGQRIAIYYKFKQELKMLKEIFPNLTEDVETYNDGGSDVIALQFVSGREGVTLYSADCLVALNIDFSALTYFQFRDRLTTQTRTDNKLYWIFAAGGIEEKIYDMVENKKSYTVSAFKKDYKIKK